MALELTLMFETALPIPFTCADGVAIPKGSLLELSDPMTVAITNGDNDPIVGVAAEEKIANDGKTTIGVYMKGIFKAYAGLAGVVAGAGCISDTGTGAANEVVVADINADNIVGRALETAADTESFMLELNPFSLELA